MKGVFAIDIKICPKRGGKLRIIFCTPIDFSPVASSRYIESLATLVLSGAYLAYLPTHYAAAWAALGRMRPIRPDEFRRSVNISLVYRKSRAMNPALTAFVDILSGLSNRTLAGTSGWLLVRALAGSVLICFPQARPAACNSPGCP